MTPRRMIVAGVLLGLVGLVYTLNCWSMPVLYTPICNDHYHDREVCIAILARMRWSLLAPIPGFALAIWGALRVRRDASARRASPLHVGRDDLLPR